MDGGTDSSSDSEEGPQVVNGTLPGSDEWPQQRLERPAVPDHWRCTDCGHGASADGRLELRRHRNGNVYCWECLEAIYEWEADAERHYYEHVDPDVRASRGDSPRLD